MAVKPQTSRVTVAIYNLELREVQALELRDRQRQSLNASETNSPSDDSFMLFPFVSVTLFGTEKSTKQPAKPVTTAIRIAERLLFDVPTTDLFDPASDQMVKVSIATTQHTVWLSKKC